MKGSAMWVFGYGSLMWDGWEAKHACMQRSVATLDGYRRSFNKGSVVNWGTGSWPCPTLNLVIDQSAACQGMAFSFDEARRAEVLAYLRKREGKNFVLTPVPIRLNDGGTVEALVPLYAGNNLLDHNSFDDLVKMVRGARGRDGSGTDYVQGIASKLAELKIEDQAVKDLWKALTAAA